MIVSNTMMVCVACWCLQTHSLLLLWAYPVVAATPSHPASCATSMSSLSMSLMTQATHASTPPLVTGKPIR